jgi:hypothetical protein
MQHLMDLLALKQDACHELCGIALSNMSDFLIQKEVDRLPRNAVFCCERNCRFLDSLFFLARQVPVWYTSFKQFKMHRHSD